MLIGDIPRFNAARYGNRPALKDEHRTLSFKHVNQRMNALIRAICAAGLKKRDRVAVLLFNCIEYCELLYALPKAGIILVPLNYKLVARELVYILSDCQTSMLIYEHDFIETVEEIKPLLDKSIQYIIVRRNSQIKKGDPSYEDLIRKQSSQEFRISMDENDLAYIIYTSGTTGFPKGAMLTHRNIITNLYNSIFERNPKPIDKLLNLPPLYHCAAQSELMVWFFFGCQVCMLKQFSVEPAMAMIAAERPNIVHMVPAMQNIMIAHPKVSDYDFSSMELMLYGASAMMRSQLIKSIEVFKCNFLQTAGQTEAGPALSFLRPEDHVVQGTNDELRKISSAGRAARLTEIKIVDENGNECPPNCPGEEIARGDNVMAGYWNMPAETAATLVDGWLHTGDICLKDEQGYIYYKDRIKDLICRGGENVYPREIEELITSHPRVLEAAVIGVPDDFLQEEIMAVVALNDGPPLEHGEIFNYLKGKIAKYKQPRYITFVNALPKNPSGKVLKREIKKQYGVSSSLPMKGQSIERWKRRDPICLDRDIK